MTHPLFRLTLALPLLLAACGTPQERCIGTATRDLRTLNGLIEETQANLSRGFAYEEYTVTRSRWVQCRSAPIRDSNGNLRPGPTYMCLDDYTDTVRRPVSIDLAEERRKLDGMLEKKRELNRVAAAQIESCKAQFPE
ncbi:hypothetical protein [Frigidibacter mobilis]|uniref:Lipoprotein n=1 Tax=Frigidibacter mobilis TaxID=1335048 RepID=A0A159Z8U4_9RHOB|nr:hypothetical protein [Frigidibacter mobilis]AMY71975.1 lipoprotein [Frigidibacter mobilis]